MMELVDTEFASRARSVKTYFRSVLQSTMTGSNESVVNYAAEHYDKVNESYKKMVDHCTWCSCSGAWVCHGCHRKIKHFASIEDKKRPVWWHHAHTQTQEDDVAREEIHEDEYWARHCLEEA